MPFNVVRYWSPAGNQGSPPPTELAFVPGRNPAIRFLQHKQKSSKVGKHREGEEQATDRESVSLQQTGSLWAGGMRAEIRRERKGPTGISGVSVPGQEEQLRGRGVLGPGLGGRGPDSRGWCTGKEVSVQEIRSEVTGTPP